MYKNILQVNIKDGDDELAILADFLRSGQITSRAITALRAFYLSLAISESPTSTPEDIRRAEHDCLSQLKQQMIYIMDKHYRDDGIEMNASEFSTVTINQSSSLSQLLNSNGVISQGDRGVTATSLSPSIVEPPVIPIVEKLSEDIEDEDEEDEDDYENMTDEEYDAAMLKVMEMATVKS